MGREVRCICRWGTAEGEVTALLETTEIIVRGDLRRRVALSALGDVLASDVGLSFTAEAEHVTLGMAPKEAAVWAARIATPPPGLAQKLGVSAAARALVRGQPPPELTEALRDASTTVTAEARVIIAVVATETELVGALAAHATLPRRHADLVVHGKGRGAAFGEAPVRAFMRERGFIDSKVAAVSAIWTATRYAARHA